jgi:tetratricopeptide (TPR) repeat protein
MRNIRTIMTTVIGISLLLACKNKSDNTTESSAYLTFQTAQKAKDYQTAVSALTAMAAVDSAKYPWVYDSLALYHYFYLNIPGLLKNPYTALHYCEAGINLNKNNDFLKELQGKLMLTQGKDSAALTIFDGLWNKTHDYTYLWNKTFVLFFTNSGKTALGIIDSVVNSKDADTKTVRFINPEMGIRETVKAKSAFLYFLAKLKVEENKILEAGEYLQECLKIDPGFLHAKSAIFELQKLSQQGGSRQ